MRRILIGLLGLVCVAGLMAALSGLLAPQARASPLADIRNQRVPLAGHTILVEAKMYMAASVGRWGYHYQVDLLHPPSGASALIFLVPSGADDRYVTASSGLWAAPRASPPLPQHPSFTATLHNLPVVGRLFAVAVPVGMAGLRR